MLSLKYEEKISGNIVMIWKMIIKKEAVIFIISRLLSYLN